MRSATEHPLTTSTDVQVRVSDAELQGMLAIPVMAQGIVLFAHGSGSSRHSPRNRFVAEVLQRAGLGTLLIDLLTEQEDTIDQVTRQYRFDISRLTLRLTGAIDWLEQQPATRGLPLGLFGASTGAAAALQAAAARPDVVRAVVSRGGRPDLASDALSHVQAPTLLIVGANDASVIPLNTDALEQIPAPGELALVPGATHLFEEPGTLATAAQLARDWFMIHFAPADAATATR